MFRYIPIVILTSVLFWTGCTFDVCSSKRMYVKSYEQFMDKVEKKQDDFTMKDWEEMDQKFERFSDECFNKYEEDLTSSERKQIMRYNFKYMVIRVKSELPFEFSEENEDKVNQFIEDLEIDNIKIQGEELEKFWKSLDKSQFKEAAEEFGKGFEKLEKALEEFGKELKESFEESQEKTK